MNKTNKFSPEVRERAVRMVQEHRGEYPSLWAAVESIAPKIGCVSQTLLDWVKREEVDSGQREGLTSSKRERLKPSDPINYGCRTSPMSRPGRVGCMWRSSSTYLRGES